METRRGLSGTALKYLAALSMLIDHADLVFQFLSPVATPDSLFYNLLRDFGRLAFPIFLFFVAEGCRKTHNFPKYLLRLGIFAVVAQVPFSLVAPEPGGSVMLTFFLGAGAVFCFETLREKGYNEAVASLPLLGACILSILLNTDYSFPAVLLLFALFLCGEDKKRQLVCLIIGLAAIYLVYTPFTGMLSALPWLSWRRIGGYLLAILPQCVIFFLCAMVAVLLLSRYDGTRGKGGKWFFYWFYPLHLLALWGLQLLMQM